MRERSTGGADCASLLPCFADKRGGAAALPAVLFAKDFFSEDLFPDAFSDAFSDGVRLVDALFPAPLLPDCIAGAPLGDRGCEADAPD